MIYRYSHKTSVTVDHSTLSHIYFLRWFTACFSSSLLDETFWALLVPAVLEFSKMAAAWPLSTWPFHLFQFLLVTWVSEHPCYRLFCQLSSPNWFWGIPSLPVFFGQRYVVLRSKLLLNFLSFLIRKSWRFKKHFQNSPFYLQKNPLTCIS